MLLVSSHRGGSVLCRCEWHSCRSARMCRFCPVASLPRRRRQCLAFIHSQDSEVRGVATSTSDVGGGGEASRPCARVANGRLRTLNKVGKCRNG